MIPRAAARGIGFLCLCRFCFEENGGNNQKPVKRQNHGVDMKTVAFFALYAAIVAAIAVAVPILGTMAAH